MKKRKREIWLLDCPLNPDSQDAAEVSNDCFAGEMEIKYIFSLGDMLALCERCVAAG